MKWNKLNWGKQLNNKTNYENTTTTKKQHSKYGGQMLTVSVYIQKLEGIQEGFKKQQNIVAFRQKLFFKNINVTTSYCWHAQTMLKHSKSKWVREKDGVCMCVCWLKGNVVKKTELVVVHLRGFPYGPKNPGKKARIHCQQIKCKNKISLKLLPWHTHTTKWGV